MTVAKGGDAGTLVNKAIITAGRPEGDVLWGVDNTLLSRALGEGVFVPYESTELDALDPSAVGLVPGHEVTPVDTGDVCLNVDRRWFEERGEEPPSSFEDLVDPAHKGRLVVQNPASSSPGLAFMLATVAHFGDPGYLDYWERLRANGVEVVEDWDTAYYSSFTGRRLGRHRPVVVSYASSPPATIFFAEEPKPAEPTTASVEATCFRQVEFAGRAPRDRARGGGAPARSTSWWARSCSPSFPLTNFVYPVRRDVPLPQLFVDFGQPAADPLTLSPEDIADHRDEWIEAWTQTVLR